MLLCSSYNDLPRPNSTAHQLNHSAELIASLDVKTLDFLLLFRETRRFTDFNEPDQSLVYVYFASISGFVRVGITIDCVTGRVSGLGSSI